MMAKRNRSDGGCQIHWKDHWHDVTVTIHGDGTATVNNFRQIEKFGWPDAAKRIAAGAGGLLKAAMGIDAAEPEVVAARQSICDVCEHNQPCFAGGKRLRCCGGGGAIVDPAKPGCGCIISQKVKVAGQRCPLKVPKW